MSYKRKTEDVYILFQNFGYGWEEVLREETRHEILCRFREYRDNQPQYPVTTRKKRVLKEM